MGRKLTATAAMVMLISAAGLDSDDWTKPMAVFLISGTWCIIYALKNYFYEEV